MNITILEDGTIKVETDQISQANHMTAEALMRNMAQACGGSQDRKRKHGVVDHSHNHKHSHKH